MSSIWGKEINVYTSSGFTYNNKTCNLKCSIYTHNVIIEVIDPDKRATTLAEYPLIDNKYLFSKSTVGEGDYRFSFFVGTADIISGLSYTSNSAQADDDTTIEPYTGDLSTCFKVFIIDKGTCKIYTQGIDLDMSSFTKGYMSFFIPGMYPEYEPEGQENLWFYNCLELAYVTDDENELTFTISHGAIDKTFYLIRWWGLDWFQSSITRFKTVNDEIRFLTKTGDDNDDYRNYETYVIAPYRWILKKLQDDVDNFNNEYAKFERRVQQLKEVIANISYKYDKENEIDTVLNFSMIPPVKYFAYKTYTREMDDNYDIQVRFVEGEDVDAEFNDIISRKICNDFSDLVLSDKSDKDFNVSFSDNINGYITHEAFSKMVTNKKNLTLRGNSIIVILANMDLTIKDSIIFNSNINFSLIGNNVIRAKNLWFYGGCMSLFSYTDHTEKTPVLTIHTENKFDTLGNILNIHPFTRLQVFTDNVENICNMKVNIAGKTNINPLKDKSRITVSNYKELSFDCNVDDDVASAKILTTEHVRTVNIYRYERNTYSRRSGTDIILQDFDYVGIRGIKYIIPNETDVDAKFEEGTVIRLLNGHTNSEVDITKGIVEANTDKPYTFLDIKNCKGVNLNIRKTDISKAMKFINYNHTTDFSSFTVNNSSINIDGLFESKIQYLTVFNTSKLYFTTNITNTRVNNFNISDTSIKCNKDLNLNGDISNFRMVHTNLTCDNLSIDTDHFKSQIYIGDSTISSGKQLTFKAMSVEITNSFMKGKSFVYKANSGRIFATIQPGFNSKISEDFAIGSFVYEPYYVKYSDSSTKVESSITTRTEYIDNSYFEYTPKSDIPIHNTIFITEEARSKIISDFIKKMDISYSSDSKKNHIIELSDDCETSISFPTKCLTTSYGKNKYKITRKKDFTYDT